MLMGLAAGATGVACSAAEGAKVLASASDSAGVRVVSLSIAPSRSRADDAVPLEPIIDRPTAAFGATEAFVVVEGRGDTIAVLDRKRGVVDLLRGDGELVATIHDPDPSQPLRRGVALAARQRTIAVLVADPVAPIRIYTWSGRLVRAGGWRIAGDLDHVLRNGPAVPEGQRFVPPEDLKLRLRAGPSAYVVFTQSFDTSSYDQHEERRRAHLVTLSDALEPDDTVSSVTPVGRRTPVGRATPGPEAQFDEAFLARRTVWAANDMRVAVQRSENSIVVLDSANRPTTIVRWPLSRRATTTSERLAVARWYADAAARSQPEAGARIRSLGTRAKKALLQRFVDMMPFDSLASDVSAVFLVHDCLWVAPWRPHDALSAIARDWIIIDLRRQSMVAHVTLPDTGTRISYIGRRVYATDLNTLGAARLRVFRAPALSCASESVGSNSVSEAR